MYILLDTGVGTQLILICNKSISHIHHVMCEHIHMPILIEYIWQKLQMKVYLQILAL